MAPQLNAPPRYVMLENQRGGPGMGMHPPPNRRAVPRYHNNSNSGGCSCARIYCCCYCCFFIIILLFVATIGFFIFFVKPELPSYSIEKFTVNSFNIQDNNKLYAEFLIVVEADNDNEEIGFEYEKDSSVDVIFSNSKLCSGQIPYFFQPEKNLTTLNIVLKGQSDFSSQTQQGLMENQKSGKIPVDIIVKVAVRLKIHGYSSEQLRLNVNCSLVIDKLEAGSQVKIISSKYKYRANV